MENLETQAPHNDQEEPNIIEHITADEDSSNNPKPPNVSIILSTAEKANAILYPLN